MRLILVLLFVVPSLLGTTASASPGDKPMKIVLKDGTRFVGKIVEDECTDEILVVRLLRGGAKRRLPWADLDAKQATELRVALGFELEDGAQGGMRVDGHAVKNKAGITFRGLWLNQKTAQRDGHYALKTSDGMLKIALRDVVSGPNPEPLDVLDVYTAEELYQKRLAEKAPTTAEDHFLLAEYCVAIYALDEAKKHYSACIELNDPKYTRDKIQRALDRIERLLADRDALDDQKAVKRAIHYNNFAKAEELLKAFKEKYAANEQLMKEAASLERSLVADRDDYYVVRVPRLVRDAVKDAIQVKLKSEKEWTFRAAQQFAAGEPSAEDSASHQALNEVAAKLKITPEQTLEYWNRRAKRAALKAFYRDGTFAVVDNLQDALAKAPKPKVSKKGPKPPKPRKIMTPDRWFTGKLAARKHTELRDWLYAWWVERGGMCEVMEPKEESCQTCAGKGYVQQMHSSSQGSVPYFDRCTTCHMATFHRVVRYR